MGWQVPCPCLPSASSWPQGKGHLHPDPVSRFLSLQVRTARYMAHTPPVLLSGPTAC